MYPHGAPGREKSTVLFLFQNNNKTISDRSRSYRISDMVKAILRLCDHVAHMGHRDHDDCTSMTICFIASVTLITDRSRTRTAYLFDDVSRLVTAVVT